MVEMHMHSGDTKVVMVVEGPRQPLRQGAGLMVVDIAKQRDARRLIGQCNFPRRRLSNHVPHSFRPTGIAATGHHTIDRPQQLVVDRDGDALHCGFSSRK
jgi:hypothetical protein